MRFYVTERLGPKRGKTAAGALVCYDVPIARTGLQIYGPDEILAGPGEVPIEPGPGGYVKVERDPDEVFRPETMASFEGVPVVNDHPIEDVKPGNWRRYAGGHVQNVHRGDAVDDSLLLGDLLIQDQGMIADVESGKRQVSCGYNAEYEKLGPGHYRQTKIIGNHVALVDSARCGPRCSIGDQDRGPEAYTIQPRRGQRKIVHVHFHV